MTPGSARYLLRVDDLCPTVKREPWLRLAALIDELGLKPILAIVPDNRDPDLRVSQPDEFFWERTCHLQAAGATIALHGYQHRSDSRGRSLVPLHRKSEFAGVSAFNQLNWIRDGVRILRSHGLNPTVWAAPRHGFDDNTLMALCAEGISVLSDGFARRPFLRGGLTWIPQQLWSPAEKRIGLWTICLHLNTITSRELEELIAFVRERSAQFTSVDQALHEFPPSRLTALEWLREYAAYARSAISRFKPGRYRSLPRLGVLAPSRSAQPAARDKDPRGGQPQL